MERFSSAAALICQRKPSNPVLGVRPHAAARAARWFLERFPGDVAYAYKANDSSMLLGALFGAGIRHFDVASIEEVETCAKIPGATLHLMNPIKPRETIQRAYHEFGVRSFSLDSEAELRKILEETGNARDLTLFVRVAVPAKDSRIPLEGKFGISGPRAADLLVATRQAADNLGVTFHVGSQTLTPPAYTTALESVGRLIVEAGVVVDIIDVGGGFPSRYVDSRPVALQAFIDAIHKGFEKLTIGGHCRLMCEPGRALVAEAESLIVRVDARRGNELYINDGGFGILYDATHFNVTFPVHLLGETRQRQATEAFSFWGPACTSEDFMKGPFHLPASVMEGDFLEIGMVGAYGRVLATRFNGFGEYDQVILEDAPFQSMYGDDQGEAGMAAETSDGSGTSDLPERAVPQSNVRAIDSALRGKIQKA
jgi:ornithine decarboxylase